MKLENVKLTLLKVSKKEGVGKKSGKDYRFYTATVVDEEANVFGFNLHDSLVPASDSSEERKLLDLRNRSIVADVEFRPKGFDISGTLTDFEVA